MTTWLPVCPLAAVKGGEMTMHEVDGHEIVLAEVDNRVYAFDAICTHALGYLDQGDLTGYEVRCPLHEGRFDIRSGEVLGGEPQVPIEVYPVQVEGDTVYVEF
jgi:naphthalene 1,2-dioxygenase system ferredoxin subunit